MKTKMLSMMVLLALSITAVNAQTEKKEKFIVGGKCGMCETRIEKAAKSVEGVTSAEWDKDTKVIEVAFNAEKVNIHQVHMAIAKVGHDTEMHRASDEVYDKLPGCCKYERMEQVSQH